MRTRAPMKGSVANVAAALAGATFVAAGCSLIRREAAAPPTGSVQVGTASWYGGAAFQGDRTASGERFDQRALTAASRSLALGSRVRVTNLGNGRSAVVRINDRGPFVRGRILDVSYAAARALGMVERGSARVRIEPLEESRHESHDRPGTTAARLDLLR